MNSNLNSRNKKYKNKIHNNNNNKVNETIVIKIKPFIKINKFIQIIAVFFLAIIINIRILIISGIKHLP